MAEAQAQVVYTNVVSSASVRGTLFAGKKFWIAQRTPSRSHFVDLVKSNGGEITLLEQQADYMICDHMRPDTPPGGISYKFIEQSIREGQLANPKEHACGAMRGAARPVGSARLASSSRRPYTAEEDRLLYKWVKDAESRGVSVLGNELYKQLEQYNSNHPWQSWRDHYIKQLQHKPPVGWETEVISGQAAAEQVLRASRERSMSPKALHSQTENKAEEQRASVAQPIDSSKIARQSSAMESQQADRPTTSEPQQVREYAQFKAIHFFELFENADDIAKTEYEALLTGFQNWAREEGTHTAAELQELFQYTVLPFHNRLREHEFRWRAVHKAMEEWIGEHPEGLLLEWKRYYNRSVKPKLPELEAAIFAEQRLARESRESSETPSKDVALEPENVEDTTSNIEADGDMVGSPSPSKKRVRGEVSPLPSLKRQRRQTFSKTFAKSSVSLSSIRDRAEVANANGVPPDLAAVTRLSAEPKEDVSGDDMENDDRPLSERLDFLAASQLQQEMSQQDLPPSSSPSKPARGTQQEQIVSSSPMWGSPVEQSVVDAEQSLNRSPQFDTPMLKAGDSVPETESILAGPTQALDLELEEPDGGFVEADSEAEDVQMDDFDDLEDEDLDLPTPEGGFEDDEVQTDDMAAILVDAISHDSPGVTVAERANVLAGIKPLVTADRVADLAASADVRGEVNHTLTSDVKAAVGIIRQPESQEDSVLGRYYKGIDAGVTTEVDEMNESLVPGSTRLERNAGPGDNDEDPKDDPWVLVLPSEEPSLERTNAEHSPVREDDGSSGGAEELQSKQAPSPTSPGMTAALRQVSIELGEHDVRLAERPASALKARPLQMNHPGKTVRARSVPLSQSEDDSDEHSDSAEDQAGDITSQVSANSEGVPAVVNSLQRQGYTMKQITEALYFTSGNAELCTIVAEELRAGRGVPDDESGIWTESDDENLRRAEADGAVDRHLAAGRSKEKSRRRESGPALKLRMLKAKHGRRGVLERREFLQSIDRL